MELTIEDKKKHNSDRDKVLKYMLDYKPHTIYEVEKDLGIYAGSVASRLRDLRMMKYGCWDVKRTRVNGTHYYQIAESEAIQLDLFIPKK